MQTFGVNSPHDLPDRHAVEQAKLLTKVSLVAGDLHEILGLDIDEDTRLDTAGRADD